MNKMNLFGNSLLFTLLLSIFIFTEGCTTPYYGFLPGNDYTIYKNSDPIDLKNKKFSVNIEDKRRQNFKVNCSDIDLDRGTELEGVKGVALVKKYFEEVIPDKNGVIKDGGQPILVELEGLSFKFYGAGYLKVHGFAQIKVTRENKSKIYCMDVSDGDAGSLLSWYSFVTRKNAARKMSSFALSRVVSLAIKDLERD